MYTQAEHRERELESLTVDYYELEGDIKTMSEALARETDDKRKKVLMREIKRAQDQLAKTYRRIKELQ